MSIEDLMASKIAEAEAKPPREPRQPREQSHNPQVRAAGGFPTVASGEHRDKSVAYPPSEATHHNYVKYRVAWYQEAGPHDKVLCYDEFEYEDGSALGPVGQFWWHLPSLLATNFLGRGGTHVVQSIEILEVKHAHKG